MNPSARLLSFSCAEPALDLALEEALQLGLEEGSAPPTWRLWQAASPAVVLGTGQEHAREVRLEAMAALSGRVALLRRHSAGGAVLIGPGVLNYSHFFRLRDFPDAQTISGAMSAGLEPLRAALSRLGVETRLAGLADLAVADGGGRLRKLAGNAQARKRVSVVVHGSLLADPDFALLENLLPLPSRVPEYRAGRGHREFLISLRELKVPYTLEALTRSLRETLAAGPAPPFCASRPTPAELERAASLRESKFAQSVWTLRR